MQRSYEQAISELYRSSPEQFIAERKRLAAKLKGEGDKESGKRLEKLPRPSLSAWTVNQLWWQARASFEQVFESAARLRSGDLGAMRAHREALDTLRGRAAEILRAGSHAVTDAVLRRVSNTLSALAANGSFDPDLPGALSADRDAPGFDATGLSGMLTAAATGSGDRATSHRSASTPRGDASGKQSSDSRQREPKEQRERAEREAERRRLELERQRIEQQRAAARAERERLEAELKQARAAAEAHVREVERLRTALAAAEQGLARARTAATELEVRLARVGERLGEGVKPNLRGPG
jgi:hypothetical protein